MEIRLCLGHSALRSGLSTGDTSTRAPAEAGGARDSPNLHDAPDGPHVHLEAVPLLAQHLRGYVIRGPAQGLLPLSVIFDFGCQSEIP